MPPQSATNLRRLTAAGLEGDYGFFDAIDYTTREADSRADAAADGDSRATGTVVRTYLAHHAGMTLVALANALLGDSMVERFHADPRVQATELLLQERVPRHAPTINRDPSTKCGPSRRRRRCRMRRFRSPHTAFPHAQFLSNGNYVTVVTNAGGGSSFCRGLAVTKSRRDPTRDPGSQFVYLRDVRSGAVWSATYHPTAAEPDDYLVEFRADRATFRRHDDGISTQLDVAVSTEDDVEVRRVTVANQSTRIREIDVTSYAEIVLAPPADDFAHPAFGKLFLETEYLADSARAALPSARARSSRAARVGHARRQPRRPAAGTRRMGNGSRAIPRSRPGHRPARPRSMDARYQARQASCSTRSSAFANGSGSSQGPRSRLSFATGIASDRERPKRSPRSIATRAAAVTHVRARLHARAEWPAPSGYLERRSIAVRTSGIEGALHRWLASGGLRRRFGRTSSAKRASGPTASPAICRFSSCASTGDDDVAARAPGASGARIPATERAERRRRHPERASDPAIWTRFTRSSRPCSTTGRGGCGSIDPAASYLLRADLIGRTDTSLLEAAARAVLGADRGDLARPSRRAAPGPDQPTAGASWLRPSSEPTVHPLAEPPMHADVEWPSADSPTMGANYAIVSRAIRRRRCHGRTSSRTRTSAPSSPPRGQRTHGRRTAGKTG